MIAAVSDRPFWRDLRQGLAGVDVRELEQVLAALGYADDLTVDTTFNAATAAAVDDWEQDLGRPDPDGAVALGDLVAVPAGAEVADRALDPGNDLVDGATVLTLGSRSLVARVDVPADQATEWKVGAAATISLSSSAGDPAGEATIESVSRDVTDGESGGTVEVTAGLDTGRPERVGTQVSVRLAIGTAAAVLSVPVAAVEADPDGKPAVRVLPGGTLVPVTLGVVADGRVEVSGDLTEGQQVRLPG